MAPELILLEDVEDLGDAGDKVNVAPGYARNYLLPRNLAQKVTPGALRVIEARKDRINAKRKEEHDKAMTLAEKISSTELTIPMQAGDDEKLFGSVNAIIIRDALAVEGIEIESRRVVLEEPIRELGMFHVQIKLPHDVPASLKVWVVRA